MTSGGSLVMLGQTYLVLLPIALALAADGDPAETRQKFLKWANMPDEHGNTLPERETIPGSFRSDFGVQVDPYCFSRNPAARPDTEKRINSFLADSVGRVMNGCMGRYPEASIF